MTNHDNITIKQLDEEGFRKPVQVINEKEVAKEITTIGLVNELNNRFDSLRFEDVGLDLIGLVGSCVNNQKFKPQSINSDYIDDLWSKVLEAQNYAEFLNEEIEDFNFYNERENI